MIFILALPLWQAFQAYVTNRAWVSFDSGLAQIQVFLATNNSGRSNLAKPALPQLVANLNATSAPFLNTNAAFVGITSGVVCCSFEQHVIQDLALRAVAPGSLTRQAATVVNGCSFPSNSSLRCQGFGGVSNAFQLYRDAFRVAPPQYALNLEYWGYVGCAFSPAPISLRAPSASALAFQASFTFSYVNNIAYSSTGFVFFLSAQSGACGNPW